MAGIPDKYKDLFQKKAFAHLATVGAASSPQVTPVWVDFDGTHIRFNTAKGRVTEITEQGADAHLDALAKKYINEDKYPWGRPGEVRVTYKILPEKINTQG